MAKKMKGFPGQRLMDGIGNLMGSSFKNGQKRYTFKKK